MIQLKDVQQQVSARFTLQVETLRLRRGITVLVGPNGAGKTSLLRLLATASELQSGEVIYSGFRLREALPRIRRNIGYMPVGLELYERMTCRGILLHLAELKGLARGGEAEEEVERLLKELDLGAYRDMRVGQLSAGQRQRVGIAQALLGRPPFVLLDEPLNYLDALEQKRVQFVLARHALRGVVVVSTHELNEWEPYAEYVLWLEEGRVAADARLEQWKADAAGLGGLYEGRIPVEMWRRLDPMRVLRVKVEGGSALVRWLGDPPSEGARWFKPAVPTLEDTYMIRRMERKQEA